MKDALKTIGIYAGIIAALLGGARGCNMAWNNRTMDRPAYTSVNYATGLSGHIEYTRYADGSQDVKEYPGVGHRLFDSELHQDLNGDGLVDRIRQNGAEWKMNRLSELLVREQDYQANKERFDEADRKLQELRAKYPAKK
jgi:hypothetical protein